MSWFFARKTEVWDYGAPIRAAFSIKNVSMAWQDVCLASLRPTTRRAISSSFFTSRKLAHVRRHGIAHQKSIQIWYPLKFIIDNSPNMARRSKTLDISCRDQS